ncbi:MAG: cyclic nucleotide-binding domain-containing protein [Pseudomonadota bacterium]
MFETVIAAFQFGGWAFLVHLAALTQVIGYLIRDQLILRIMLFVGTLLYIAYYRLYPDTPLWDAIFWGTALGCANLFIIVQIIRDRTCFQMSSDEERLYAMFNHIRPGDFRRLMKIASFRRAGRSTVLTREGDRPDELYYVIDGDIRLEKAGRRFSYSAQTFIGELAMVTNAAASATVALDPGSNYVAWDRERLDRLISRHPTLKLAFDLLVTRDIAAKVQRA